MAKPRRVAAGHGYKGASGRAWFINKDPIEEQGGLNLYAFCSNNGVNHWDLLGQFEKPSLLTEDGNLSVGDYGSGAGGHQVFQEHMDMLMHSFSPVVDLTFWSAYDSGNEKHEAQKAAQAAAQKAAEVAPNSTGSLAAQSAFVLGGTAITASPFELAAAEAAAAAGGGFTAGALVTGALTTGGVLVVGGVATVAGGGFVIAALPVLAPITTGNNWLKLPTPPITQMGGSAIPVGPTIYTASPGGYSFPSAGELARRLGVPADAFHREVKPEILQSFPNEMRSIGSTNPNIGIDRSGNVVLQNPSTGKTAPTNVPISVFGPGGK